MEKLYWLRSGLFPKLFSKVRITQDDFHRFHLEEAYSHAMLNASANRSELGAIIADPATNIIYRGTGVLRDHDIDYPKYLQIPVENGDLIHPEIDAIQNADAPLDDMSLYSPLTGCEDCVEKIIEAGIDTVVAHYEMMLRTPSELRSTIVAGFKKMQKAGIKTLLYKGKVSQDKDPQFLKSFMNGQVWYP